MVCAVFSKEGKQSLGEGIYDFMQNQRLWPESLKRFYEGIPRASRRRGLTQGMLLNWMAEETGFEELSDENEASHQRFKTLLGRYKDWHEYPERSAGESIMLLSAIAHCGIVRDSGGRVIKDINDLVKFLYGSDVGTEL